MNGSKGVSVDGLLDQTNYGKSVGQLVALLHVLECEVELVVKTRSRKTA